eukprot:g42816.t1
MIQQCCTEPFAKSIRKDVSLRRVTNPGSRGLQIKASLFMDDVTIFCSDLLSVHRLMRIFDQFKPALGAKANQGKSGAMLFRNWTNRSFIPFTIRTDYLYMLGIWDAMYKALDKGRKNVPNTTLILMVTLACGCIKLCVDPWNANTKCHCVLRFYLSPELQRMGQALLLWYASSSWTIPYYLSYVEKFARNNSFDHKSVGSGQHIASSRPCGKRRGWILLVCSLSRLSKSFDRVPHYQNFPTSTKTSFGW